MQITYIFCTILENEKTRCDLDYKQIDIQLKRHAREEIIEILRKIFASIVQPIPFVYIQLFCQLLDLVDLIPEVCINLQNLQIVVAP